MELRIERYANNKREAWENFILKDSINATFLQTRKFIEYHPKSKYEDYSLCIYKENTLIATILANKIVEKNKIYFYSHQGTSYAGINVSESFCSTSKISFLIDTLEDYLIQEEFTDVYLKMTPTIYSPQNTDLLEYFLYQRNYTVYNELNYYMHLDRYKEGIELQFSAGKRRDYRYSLKNDLTFKKIDDCKGIKEFYHVLNLNLKKLGLPCIHTYEELLDLKFNRFNNEIEFYGVYKCNEMIAGSMIFIINDKVFHTQYLSSNEEFLKYYSMDFLIYHLIDVALEKNMDLFSMGVCTEEKGKYLNLGLSRFKEGFGAEFTLNKSFEKRICL